MNKDTGIPDELKSMGSPLAGMSRAMPYKVPKGYFEQFDKELLSTISEINSEAAIWNNARSMPFGNTPQGYFDELPGKLLQMAKAETAVRPGETNIVLKPRKRLIALGSIRWAAAAMLVMALGIGSYTFLFRHNETGTDKLLSSVPNNELHEYLQNTCRIDVDRVVNNNTLTKMKLDNKDIISYLDETGWDVVD